MKKLFVSLCLTVCAYGAFAQGQINLISNGATKPVYGVDKTDATSTVLNTANRDKLAGAAYTFEVWYAAGAGKTEGDLKALTRGEFRVNGVFLKSGVVDIPGVMGGDQVTLQVRAWATDSRITSWADLDAPANADVARGKSNIISKAAGGKDGSGAVVLPLSLAGAFDSFGLYTVPEPSVIALGALGLGALVLRRRK
jgi:PEP-CTERM motif